MPLFAVVLMLAAALDAAPASPAAPGSGDYVKVEVRGTLRSGMVAIGGETTGTVIKARGATWELDLRQLPGGMARAESLDGRTVVVKGSLEVRRGVERGERTIVSVTSLEPARPAPER
jgi:hypothetical protein